jgi:hypothetical protein
MPTGDEFVNLALKRFLSRNRMDANFLEYLQEDQHDGLSRIFPEAGLFTYPVTITPNGPGKTFTLTPDPIEGIDNAGHVFIITGASRLVNIPFENNPGDTYWIGFRYNEIPSGVYTNPGSGQFEYDKIAEEVGELAEPSAITDLGGTILFNCNSIFESSVDHSGRTVRVWLKNPLSGDAAVAFEDLTVVYDGGTGENRVVTSGALGQTTISTATTDYQIACIGCTVRKSVSNPYGDEYLDIGNIVGHATTPTTNTTGIQLDLSGGGGHSLQAAYDGAAGSGSGRNILADDQAVQITQENDTILEHDVMHAALRITKDSDKAVPGSGVPETEVGIDLKMRLLNEGAIVARLNISDGSGSTNISAEEVIDVEAASNRVKGTRGGVDFTNAGNYGSLVTGFDFVEITGSVNGNDGVYRLNSVVDADELDLLNLDGTTPTFTVETSSPSQKISIYRPTSIITYRSGGIYIYTLNDFLEDNGSPKAPGLTVVSPESSTRSDVIAQFIGKGTPDYDVQINARGEIIADGNILSTDAGTGANAAIRATVGDIRAEQDLLAGDNITAETGNITATAGHIIATAGNISATSGTVTAGGGGDVISASGKVEATNGNVIAGGSGSVTSANDVTATAGDIICSNTKDHKYSAARTAQEKRFSPAAFSCEEYDDAGDSRQKWRHQNGDVTSTVPVNIIANVQDAKAYVQLVLPDNCTITGVEAIVKPNSTGVITMEVNRVQNNYTTPAYGAPASVTSDSSDGTSSIQVLKNPSALTEVVENDKYSYYIVIESAQSGDIIYEARVIYSVTNLRV